VTGALFAESSPLQADKLFCVKDLVVLVTGAGSGLGLAIAEVLAENGAIVTMLDIREATLKTQHQRLAARKLSVHAAVADVANSGELRLAIDAVVQKWGRIDVVFANAGISGGPGFKSPNGRIEAVPGEHWDNVIRVNLTSVFETMQAAATHMKNQGRGRIIVTSSISGLRAEPRTGYAYAAAKSGVNNLVRQAALELAPFGVLVNAIAPGPFLTNIADGRLHTDIEAADYYRQAVPLGRIADPAEIQGLAMLLASSASSYITGAVIPIDGGMAAI
jgi:NAD(P)-dependent dehydrogenase (short-subunit alcohol dehydrogenase family)